MQNIEFGSVSSDRYPDPAGNASIEVIQILNMVQKQEICCLKRKSLNINFLFIEL